MKSGEADLDDYDVMPCAAGDLGEADLTACVDLIAEGNAVDPISARRTLPNAIVLAVARKDGRIVGIGAVKPVRAGYAAHTAEESQFSFDPETPELGYIAVNPVHRNKRLSSRIVSALTSQHQGPLFARTSDARMKSALKKAGFGQPGDEWEGLRGDSLSLWIRE
jgi:hypothetical protein